MFLTQLERVQKLEAAVEELTRQVEELREMRAKSPETVTFAPDSFSKRDWEDSIKEVRRKYDPRKPFGNGNIPEWM